MSRTIKNAGACGRARCGLCHPDKRWPKGDRVKRLKPADRRRAGDDQKD